MFPNFKGNWKKRKNTGPPMRINTTKFRRATRSAMEPGSLMSLYGNTSQLTPVDLCIIFQCNLYIYCTMSCGNKIVSKLFQPTATRGVTRLLRHHQKPGAPLARHKQPGAPLTRQPSAARSATDAPPAARGATDASPAAWGSNDAPLAPLTRH